MLLDFNLAGTPFSFPTDLSCQCNSCWSVRDSSVCRRFPILFTIVVFVIIITLLLSLALLNRSCTLPIQHPWLALVTEVVIWHCIRANSHTFNMLPYTALVTTNHVAIIMIKFTYTPCYAVVFVILISSVGILWPWTNGVRGGHWRWLPIVVIQKQGCMAYGCNTGHLWCLTGLSGLRIRPCRHGLGVF